MSAILDLYGLIVVDVDIVLSGGVVGVAAAVHI